MTKTVSPDLKDLLGLLPGYDPHAQAQDCWFDAAEAHRIGLVQEVVPHGAQLGRAREIAGRIAAQAPLAVQATLANARAAIRESDAQAEQQLQPELVRLASTDDAGEGMRAFVARDEPAFRGR